MPHAMPALHVLPCSPPPKCEWEGHFHLILLAGWLYSFCSHSAIKALALVRHSLPSRWRLWRWLPLYLLQLFACTLSCQSLFLIYLHSLHFAGSIWYQWDIQDCNIISLTETWLTPTTLDHAKLFSVHWMDKKEESDKSRRGGLCLMTTNKWCGHWNVVFLIHSWSPNLELLRIKSTLYIHSSQCHLYSTTSKHGHWLVWATWVLANYQNNHWDAALIVAGILIMQTLN